MIDAGRGKPLKVLVTGGAGFIGSYILEELERSKVAYVVVDDLSTGSISNVPDPLKIVEASILGEELDEIFQQESPTHVLHLAAQSNVNGANVAPYRDASINILGTIRILECCRKYGCSKIVYSSSAAIYGNSDREVIDEETIAAPISNYGISKYVPEQYIRSYSENYGLDYTILRYSNVFGARQNSRGEGGVISLFLDCVRNQRSPHIFGDGQQTRDFVYVKDVALANYQALNRGSRQTLNISSYTRTSINDLYELLMDIAQIDLLPIYSGTRVGDIKHSCLVNTKAQEELDWHPTYSLKEALQETLQQLLLETSLNVPAI